MDMGRKGNVLAGFDGKILLCRFMKHFNKGHFKTSATLQNMSCYCTIFDAILQAGGLIIMKN